MRQRQNVVHVICKPLFLKTLNIVSTMSYSSTFPIPYGHGRNRISKSPRDTRTHSAYTCLIILDDMCCLPTTCLLFPAMCALRLEITDGRVADPEPFEGG